MRLNPALRTALDKHVPRETRETGDAWRAFLYWITTEPGSRTWAGVTVALGRTANYVKQIRRWAERYGWLDRAHAIDAAVLTYTGQVLDITPADLPDEDEPPPEPPAPPPPPPPPPPNAKLREAVEGMSDALLASRLADHLQIRGYMERVRELHGLQLELSIAAMRTVHEAIRHIDPSKLKPFEIAALHRVATTSATAAIDSLSELEGISDYMRDQEDRLVKAAKQSALAAAPDAADDGDEADFEG